MPFSTVFAQVTLRCAKPSNVLLDSDEQARSFLESPAPLTAVRDDEPAGSRLGPHRINRLLGRGGMGTVYLATRDDGLFEREVALKILHFGTLDPDALQRFRSERQNLARLEHPAIARLYDGGETVDGVPFLVMEYVQGQPINAYCDGKRLSVEDRLKLFLRLLDAVSYAHRNLLVHRDIKPANILVTEDGEPKLLDFGIAKRLVESESGAAATRFRMMTPAYASPEQVRVEPITTASDVYSLGVLLYELLCGRSPYRLATSRPRELEEAILSQEPERPSHALECHDEEGPTSEEISATRNTRPRELRRKLNGDLDTIVLKALRKEPQRRYRSVDELASDIDYFLGAFPISARPDTALYLAGKFVRRHRWGVALAGATLMLIATLVVSVFAQRNRAERERDKARTAMEYLVDVFERADPFAKGAENVTVRDLLATGARHASHELSGDPEVQSELLDALGRASVSLGQLDQAAPLLGKALVLRRKTAPGTLELAETLDNAGWLHFQQSDYEGAEALLREAVTIRRRLLGADSPEVAFLLNRIGTVMTERYQNTSEERSREIEALHREALAIYEKAEPDGRGVGDSVFQLAKVAQHRSDLPQAERLYRQVLGIDEVLLGPDHPETNHCRRALALVLNTQGKLPEAEQLMRRALASQRKILPRDHPDIAWTLNDLALVRQRRGALGEAELLMRDGLRLAAEILGESHANSSLLMSNLANILQEEGKAAEAAQLHEKALAIKRGIFDERHIHIAKSLSGLARAESDLGRHTEAEGLARQALGIARELLKPDHPDLASYLRTMGIVLLKADRPAEAETFLREALALLGKSPTSGLQLPRTEVALGGCLTSLGRYAEAAQVLTRARQRLEAKLPPDHIWVREARERLDALNRAQALRLPTARPAA